MLSLTVDDFLNFVDGALDGMMAIVTDLGDELANRRPDLPGANSPYAILTHCLGVMEFWGGHVVHGRPSYRDRPAEFRASGSVVEVVERARTARHRLALDLEGLDPLAPPLRPKNEDIGSPLGRTQAGVILHIYEELAQHHGQMEITRDVLRAATAPGP